MNHTSFIEISKKNLIHNVNLFKSILPTETKISAVIKANAYGHGQDQIALIIKDYVDYFQVNDIEELRQLSKITKEVPCLVLGYVEIKHLQELVLLNGIPMIYTIEQAEELNTIGFQLNKLIEVHLEIDSFLGRLGLLESDALLLIDTVAKFKYLKISFLFSHFSDIEDTYNLEHAKKQFEYIKNISNQTNIPFHLPATSGILSSENAWESSIARLGIGMYGLWPSENLEKVHADQKILPVLSWKTKVAQVKILPKDFPIGYGKTFITKKETKIAVIPQGYSDGYDRKFSNNGNVLIQRTRCKILGRVAMNMFVVDVSHIQEVKTGDEVVLLGKQGSEEITAAELSLLIETINYEVVARINALLPRVII